MATPADRNGIGSTADRTGLVDVVMRRDLNVMYGKGRVEQFGVGQIIQLPACEAEAWCAAGWASVLAQVEVVARPKPAA